MYLMNQIIKENIKDFLILKQYNQFVYTIACNVPNSITEEGSMNKYVKKTIQRQKIKKEENGYFYLEAPLRGEAIYSGQKGKYWCGKDTCGLAV